MGGTIAKDEPVPALAVKEITTSKESSKSDIQNQHRGITSTPLNEGHSKGELACKGAGEGKEDEHLEVSFQGKDDTARDNSDPDSSDETLDYETQRQRNIQQNQKLMLELGLKSIIPTRDSFPILDYRQERDDGNDDYIPEDRPSRSKSNRVSRGYKRRSKPVLDPVQTRSSKRTRGEKAEEYNVDLEKLEKGLRLNPDGEPEPTNESISESSEKSGAYSKSLWRGRRQASGYSFETEVPHSNAPLTLGSIGTTIWEVGSLYKGKENRRKYWSGNGSLYKHPYPIGFKAEKFHFRERYMMHIEEGSEGPIFIVESSGGKRFEGATPTQPWTKACLASYSRGTRISGPLFFGFSDPITQKMIEELEGYQPWEVLEAELKQERAKAEAEARAEAEAQAGVNESIDTELTTGSKADGINTLKDTETEEPEPIQPCGEF
ncbi:hypothetical protein BGW38_010995 [Lunasporangiospora selenospora]|uniref:FYR N-terminal domain-containing protein n=1 Tax=Lunasporangiospora selenospora TaxID=979761 RepID=A0A9P6KFC1_9FUNG|nr:hypothetical protein BGW38_010995 [Lunasporangiospora selenospora]